MQTLSRSKDIKVEYKDSPSYPKTASDSGGEFPATSMHKGKLRDLLAGTP